MVVTLEQDKATLLSANARLTAQVRWYDIHKRNWQAGHEGTLHFTITCIHVIYVRVEWMQLLLFVEGRFCDDTVLEEQRSDKLE
jgi:hypothetical protein